MITIFIFLDFGLVSFQEYEMYPACGLIFLTKPEPCAVIFLGISLIPALHAVPMIPVHRYKQTMDIDMIIFFVSRDLIHKITGGKYSPEAKVNGFMLPGHFGTVVSYE